MINIAFIFGTRPEVIKMAPVILEFKKYPMCYNVLVINTEQQKELSNQTLKFFGITPTISLNVMRENQSLSSLQSILQAKLEEIFLNNAINLAFVQGDTMSAFCGALSAYYFKVPICHIEAGLRSYNLFEPFPEEALRQMIARIANIHFAPTKLSVKYLQNENLTHKSSIYEVGNTSIDALFLLEQEIINKAKNFWNDFGIDLSNDDIVLVTIHRRENHGDRLEHILNAISYIASKFQKHKFIIPIHPNPNVREKIKNKLYKQKNIYLCDALDYPNLVLIMKNSKLILTDSGGIQEEAPSFGVPLLVLRYETERKEGVESGFAKLVGADYDLIIKESFVALKNNQKIDGINPYGDGMASQRIEKYVRKFLNLKEYYAR
ncbi:MULTISPECIES: non-hydrolyzing UDP-N-acetylglucosamine 2-epimerase [Campylobacter]|uniref:non-hydrolyzing UDP-N-acetylglucosamine 2-epimerase n=1 Tax=Campylobacter TaxID=194 RepID=UPI000A336E38|nr:UDP-N-acetylglucosamine 2-epimerase (non-hydrolyzing) [Campylobacter sp. P0124]MCR8696912.1 UDP-N-acetylglucosamine 2-epimerase (non-hydrolyzing) [Campylobacter sp. RM19073]